MADYSAPSDFKFFGYAAQSAVQSKGINVGGSENSDWSFNKRDVTVFGEYYVRHGVSARAAVGTIDEPFMRDRPLYVKYALVDKQWNLDNKNIVGTRIGRVPHSFGFYNSVRTSPSSSYFIYYPEGLPGYHENFKYVALSGTGGQLYWYNQISPAANVEVTGTYTKASMINSKKVIGALINDEKFATFGEDDSYVGSFAVEGRYKDLNLHYNYINMNFMFKPNTPWSLAIPPGKLDTHVHVVGAKKFIGDFEFSGEYLAVRLKGSTWDKLSTSKEGSPVGWVLASTWHATPKLDLSVYRTEYYIQDGDKSGVIQTAAAAKTGAKRYPHWYYTKANSIAAKYKVSESVTANMQYTKGSGIAAFDKASNLTSGKDWSYTAVQVVYNF